MIGVSTIVLALLVGAYLTINHQDEAIRRARMSNEPLSLSMLLLFYGLLAGMSDPARKLSEVFSRIQRGAAAAERNFQLVDRQPQIVDPPRPMPLRRHRRELLFEAVDFHYHPTHPVLEQIDLRIPFGEALAIVGPNGCGKSTLANLVPRLLRPHAGARCVLDGIDLRNLRLKDLRRQIGLVTQETLLFDDTVANNTFATARRASPARGGTGCGPAGPGAPLHRRAIDPRLSNYRRSTEGLAFLGRTASADCHPGARAILRDPAILILDEATSQIDLESEQIIQQVLQRQFIHNRTTIIITHRMSVLSLADRIVVMNSGRILDVGTHDQLLSRCELYGRLYDIQLKEIA